MVDTIARSKMAELARSLIAGRITNDQFEDGLPQSEDPAIREIFVKGFWPLYSDDPEHRLIGEARVGGEDRGFAARCILFLKSNQPYEWPTSSALADELQRLLNLVTRGAAERRELQKLKSIGDVETWPFRNQAELEQARQSPPYLRGD